MFGVLVSPRPQGGGVYCFGSSGGPQGPAWIQPGSRLDPAWIQAGSSLGVLAGPGTPRDPKSHLFVTNWVAIQPFCTSEAGIDAEFRRGSRQIGPTPSISTFLGSFFDPKTLKNVKNRIFWEGFEKIFENRPGLSKMVPQGPGGPLGPIFHYFPSIFGSPWAPWSPIKPPGALGGSF